MLAFYQYSVHVNSTHQFLNHIFQRQKGLVLNYEEMHERTEDERGKREGETWRRERDLKCYLVRKKVHPVS